MKSAHHRPVDKVKTLHQTRVPIPMSLEEEKALIQLAESEQRSKQSMAGIIYRLGLKTYQEIQKGNRKKPR